jgi:hypothetical protein
VTILTTAEFRAFEDTELGDVPLQTLLDAAEIEIVRFAGDPTTATEWIRGGQAFVYLKRPASSVTSIVEWNDSDGSSVTLAADDYLAYPGGFAFKRISTGTNPRSTWRDRSVWTYTPQADTALRKVVQVDLIKLALNFSPGVISERIGDWSETFQQAMDSNDRERGEILSRLSYGPSLVVVGG